MKQRLLKIGDFLALLIGGLLLVTLLISSLISNRRFKDKKLYPDQIVNYAKQYMSDENIKEQGFNLDCSGFTSTVYKRFGVKLPRSSAKQYQSTVVTNTTLNTSDLVFFKTGQKEIGHVGIYISDSLFIHSPGKSKDVKLDSMDNPYYAKRYIGFGKVLPDNIPGND